MPAGLAYQLVSNRTYAANFPFIVLWPCTECDRSGLMVPFGNTLYTGGRPEFGQVGFTPRNLLRVDRLIDAALKKLGVRTAAYTFFRHFSSVIRYHAAPTSGVCLPFPKSR